MSERTTACPHCEATIQFALDRLYNREKSAPDKCTNCGKNVTLVMYDEANRLVRAVA